MDKYWNLFERMVFLIRLGASTACFYPMETEKALKHLGELGFSVAEVFFNSFSELCGPLLEAIRREQQAYGMQVVSVHPFTSGTEAYFLFSAYERRFRDTLEYYKRYFDAANALGAKILVIHGAKRGMSITEAQYFDRFGELVRLGKAQGITVSQENVVQYASESTDFLIRMRSALGGDFHMVLDIKQAVRSGLDPLALARRFSGEIVHVHVSDHLPGRDCLPPGEGAFDFRALCDVLEQSGYQGSFVIELYAGNFEEDRQLTEAKAFLEKLSIS